MDRFQQIIDRGHTAYNYRALRIEHPEARAIDVYNYLSEGYGLTFEQYSCAHEFFVDEYTDRCYCCYCGLDGDA